MSAPRINLTIDRLVLRGVDPQHAKAMTESLKKELGRILAASGAHDRLQRAKDEPVMRLGRVALEPGRAGARKFGAGLAGAIAKGVKQ